MLVVTGAACMNDRDVRGNDIKYLRESLFSQVLSETFLIHANFGITNLQIMVLVVCGNFYLGRHDEETVTYLNHDRRYIAGKQRG
jgi:hypothetical protein